MSDIIEGARVLVFDSLLFINDVDTPLSMTVRPATVVCRYGCHSDLMCNLSVEEDQHFKHQQDCTWNYPDLVDVIFDHRPDRVSKGHFTRGVKLHQTNRG